MLDGADWRTPQHTWRPQNAAERKPRVHSLARLWLTAGVIPGVHPIPDDVAALRAALVAEQSVRREAEEWASGAEAMVAHLKLMIAKLRHEQFGASSERGRKLLDQLELQLEELEAGAAEDQAALDTGAADKQAGQDRTRRKPVRGALPAHLPRERVVIFGPTNCPCCQGKMSKLGEDVTETLEVVPRRFKVIQTVREKMVSRARRSASLQRRSTELHAGVPDLSCWRRSWRPDLSSTCRSTARARRLAARASSSTLRRWRTGPAPTRPRCRR